MEEKKVYIVTSGDYEDYGINAVFSTKEAAQKFIDDNFKNANYYVAIEEYELDKTDQ